MIDYFNISKQDKSIKKKILQDISKVISNNNFILGKPVYDFEIKFSKFCNVKYAVSCANGTDALSLALKSLNLPRNSEVILPAMTYISTLLAVINNNLKPVLVDIVKGTSLISIDDIKKKINSKTKVILPVHLYGSVVDIRKIKKIIKNKNIYIIDDAAQAHGAKNVDNKKVGSLSDISCFSFYPGKNLGCYGDGGIVTTNNKFFYNKIRKLRNLGSDKKYIHDEIGINSRLDTIQASILLNKIAQLSFFNKKRNKIAKYYDKYINNKKINKIKYSKNSVYHLYVIITKNRNLLIKEFEKNKIPFGIHYPKPLHKLDCFKKIFKGKKFPNSEKLSNCCLSLPIDPNLSLNDIKKIVKVLNFF